MEENKTGWKKNVSLKNCTRILRQQLIVFRKDRSKRSIGVDKKFDFKKVKRALFIS